MKRFSIVYNSKRIFTKKFVYIVWVPLIILAKTIRYTVLKNTLVDHGIGHQFLNMMQRATLSFDLFEELTRTTDSSGNAVFIYQTLNFFKLNTYGQFEIAISIIINIFMMFLVNKIRDELDELQFFYLLILILAVNIFDLCLSKEPIQIVLFSFLAYIIRRISDKEISCVLMLTVVIVLIGILFRTYCLLMLPFAGYSLLIYKRYQKNRNFWCSIIFLLIGSGVLYGLCLFLFRHISMGAYIELIRVRSRIVHSNTQIVPLIKNADNLFLYTMNYLVVILRLLFPIELLRLGIRHIVYFICQLVITFVFLRAFFLVQDSDTICKFAIVIFLSFLFMSAAHEIEFGSWIRHEVAIFPILIMLDKNKGNSG